MERQFLVEVFSQAISRPHNNNRCKIAVCLSLAILISACQSNIQSSQGPSSSNLPIRNETSAVQQSIENPPLVGSQEVIGSVDEESTNNLWQRIRNGFQLQSTYDHESVQRYIEAYSSNQRLFDLVTERAEPFLFHIVEEIEDRGLPMELALLPIVESTYNPNAYSQEHAVGLWQFIGPTARSFGIDSNWWYDGRRDPLVSTPAALEYLSVLHTQFNEDWLVAIGAYNTGDGNVRRAIRRSKQDPENIDFWTLPLAPETRSHVPKLLALASIVANEQDHEIELTAIANEAAYITIELPAQMDISQAALMMDLEYEELRRFNPGFLQWATHPDGPHSLFVPRDKAQMLRTQLSDKTPEQLLTWDRYEIQSGDSLSKIAKILDTRVDVLMVANSLNSSAIVAGESLLVPRNISSLEDLSNYPQNPSPNSRASVPIPKNYTIRRGDNLWTIARKFNLKSTDIAQANNFELSTTLFPGEVLDLEFATLSSDNTIAKSTLGKLQNAHHTVRRGDSIDRISKLYDLEVSDLLIWNKLDSTQLIYPGQLISLSPPDQGIN